MNQKNGVNWKRVLVRLAAVVIVALIIIATQDILDPWGWHLYRSRYERIVHLIELQGLAPGQDVQFLVARSKEPSSLRPYNPNDSSFQETYDNLRNGRIIYARRGYDGSLEVRLTIKSKPHAGTYGLLYSSSIPGESTLKNAFGSDGKWRRIAHSWWAIEDRSD